MDDIRPFLPGISYYDNPAGQSVDRTRIPVIAANDKLRKGFYEEHRFPLPFAAVEGVASDGMFVSALHVKPSPIAFGNRLDQWWSLGVEYKEDRVELASYSGPVASNGRNATIKGHQKKWHPYDHAWITIPPDGIVEKTYFIETARAEQRGSGFQTPLWTSIEIANPYNPDGFPPLKEVIERKFSDSLDRWHESEDYAGIKAFPGPTRDWIDLAWAGQSEAFAYPFLLMGKQFGVTDVDSYAQKGLDFISSSPFTEDGFAIRYDFKVRQWLDRRNPLSQGQAMNNMLDALRVAKGNRNLDTSKWERFLARSSEEHANRILAENWRPKSTNEGFLIAPLAKASTLLDNPRFMDAALKAGKRYQERHLSMDEPYWGGTLDARCEDKEGAWAALQGFLALYETTQEKQFLEVARHAADVVISYLYIWDVPLPAGRLSDHGFKTRGWTSVSAQNMHLDVYGVLCSPALWKLGTFLGNENYQRLARLMLVSCGQLLDPLGSQGEQIQQTNYSQHYDYTDLKGVRGEYVESWNVYWITAHFLVATAQLEEMGVTWQDW